VVGRFAYASVAVLGPRADERQPSLARYFVRRVAQQAQRLRKTRTRLPYVVLTDRPEAFRETLLEEPGISLRVLNETLTVPCNMRVLMYTGRWASTWTGAYQKLQVFGLVEFSKVLLLDLDVKIHGNLDHIFNVPLPLGGVAGQRNDDICLGDDFDKYLDLPIIGQESRRARRDRDLLTHTGYARLVERLFELWNSRKGGNTSASLELLNVGASKIGRQKLSRSPRDTWNLGLNSGVMLLVPNQTDLKGLQESVRFLPGDCSEWWPDGADQVVVANYFANSSRVWLLPATDASYAHCAFLYATSGYVADGKTIRAQHATCEKYFPELIGAFDLLTALGVPRAAHGLLWAYWKASTLWGKITRLRRKEAKQLAKGSGMVLQRSSLG